MRKVTAAFRDDCLGLVSITADYPGRTSSTSFTFGTTPPNSDYEFVLQNNEFIVQMTVEHATDGSAIYGVQFYTNWGRDSGMLGPGAPDDATTTKVSEPADGAINYQAMLVGFELGETLIGTLTQKITGTFGVCDGGLA